MSNLDVEIYMTNFKKYFENNPDQLTQLVGNIEKERFFDGVRKIVEENSTQEDKALEPTRKQLIGLLLDLNGVTTNIEKVLPFMEHHMGLICLN